MRISDWSSDVCSSDLRVGARRAADRRLVDVDDLVAVLDPLDGVVGAGKGARLVQAAGQRLVERLDDERRLAAAGDAGDAGEGAERHRRIDLLQVVRGGAEAADRSAEHTSELQSLM